MKTKFAPVLAAAVWACTGLAQAITLHNGVGLSLPHQTLDFESVALGFNAPVTTQFSSMGATFLIAFGNPDTGSFPNVSGNRVGNFQAGNGVSGLFTVDFASALSEVAFAVVSAPGTATFQAFRNGNLVESFTGLTSPNDANNFYGFQGITMDRLTVRVQSFDRAFLLDNLQTIQQVPEPQAGLLMAAGMATLGMLAQRRRRSRAD